jgi:short subunit dehydrogenase-like uncharacterized protein
MLMIYGATGYTGHLASIEALKLGLDIVLAGRSETPITDLAHALHTPFRIFSLENPEIVDNSLQGVQVLLNCAGPFHRTAKPLVESCIRNSVHYLDIAAELDSYTLSEEKSDEAGKANIMLLPGCGGSVAMLGCLTKYTLARMFGPAQKIDIALQVTGVLSRGSALSAEENMSGQCLQRQDGRIVVQEVFNTLAFDFDDGQGQVQCFPVTLPDLITIAKTSSVQNIRTYVYAAGATLPTGDLDAMADGPDEEERDSAPYDAAVTIMDVNGREYRSVLHTINGYSFTAIAAVCGAQRVLVGQFIAGFQTPADLWGMEFVKDIGGSSFVDQ